MVFSFQTTCKSLLPIVLWPFTLKLSNRSISLLSILIFILTIVLLSMDFYYLKNIAGRRLVGLRWWNEVDPATGDSKWVFESADTSQRPGGTNKTDSRFFWLALYVQPALWIGLAILAVVRLSFVWLSVIGKFRPMSLCAIMFSFGWGRRARRRRSDIELG